MPKIRVLFVCLGNICRSPTAEGVFSKLVKNRGCEAQFYIDSAGTGAWHAGERADRRMRKAASARGYQLESIARQVKEEDFDRFDHLIAMDTDNAQNLRAMSPKDAQHKIALLRSFSNDDGLDVPDPYYGGPQGFDDVVDIVEHACEALLNKLLGPK